MAKFAYSIFAITLALVAFGFVGRMLVVKIGPNVIGVRSQEFAILGPQGVVAHDFDQPGWYRNFWFIDRWNYFDKTVHTLRFIGEDGDSNPLTVKSKDGYDVIVHVRVKYHIKPHEAHLLLKTLGPFRENYERLVENEAIDACRIEFGEMVTEDFYNPEAREKAAIQVRTRLQRALDPRHLEVLDILISSVAFDPQYEQKIKAKKLADQDVEVSKSRAESFKFKGETKKVKAETEALVKRIQAELEREIAELRGRNEVEMTKVLEEANAYGVEKRAKGDLEVERAKAEASLLLRQAEAEGERAKTLAMSGPGGRALVALEAARNLQIQAADISTLGTDLLDVEAMAEKLGAPK